MSGVARLGACEERRMKQKEDEHAKIAECHWSNKLSCLRCITARIRRGCARVNGAQSRTAVA